MSQFGHEGVPAAPDCPHCHGGRVETTQPIAVGEKGNES